ncbi:MAG: class I SAM-dependent methyltransferase [Candidatus Promineifilaceae bacterium]
MQNETMQTYAQIADTFLKVNNRPKRHAYEIGRFLSLLPTNSLILDVGCGPGYDAATFRQQGYRAIATDLSLEMMQVGRGQFGGSYLQADMCHLPFGPIFDALWISASLLHLPKPNAIVAIAEFARLLKPNGILFMTVKEGDGDGMTKEAYGYPLRRYFNYWHSAELDGALSTNFTPVDGWRKVYPNGTQPWLVRFAQRK